MLENEYDVAYGQTFNKFTKSDLYEVVSNFHDRYGKGADAQAIFEGKKCLDGGCGAGRGSLYMLSHGASYVHAVDISPENVLTTRSSLKEFGFENASVQKGSIVNLPFDDESFDVVWSYGVVHHTENPAKAMHELSRILKVGGTLVIFLYGQGDIQFLVHQIVRKHVRKLTSEECLSILETIKMSVHDRASCMDNWYGPFINTYTEATVAKALTELGFERSTPIKNGKVWDTNYRKYHIAGDEDIMGAGDLRVITKKVSATPQHTPEMPGYDISVETDLSVYCDRLVPLADKIDKILKTAQTDHKLVSLSYKIFRNLYDEYYKPTAIDIDEIVKV